MTCEIENPQSPDDPEWPPTMRMYPPGDGLAGLHAALARGEAAKAHWVRSREVIAMERLATKWEVSVASLSKLEKRGDVFSINVNRRAYVPKEFHDLAAESVATICRELYPLDSSQKLVFWKVRHGALGGRTVFEALCGREVGVARVRALASAHAAQAATDKLRASAPDKLPRGET